jgi:hypothetical protein
MFWVSETLPSVISSIGFSINLNTPYIFLLCY